MANIVNPRPSATFTVKFDVRPLEANTKVFKGGLVACYPTGFYGPPTGAAGETLVGGRFYQTVDNTGGAAGAMTANVEFFRERALFLVDNDTLGAPLTVVNRERLCSALDDHTATVLAAGKDDLGIVYDVTSEGVLIEFLFPSSPQDASVPPIQHGTGTLTAGTKTIAGVVLGANSHIVVTMKDPGAGAIPAFACLDVPAGTRTGTQFVVNAIDNTKAVIATAVSTFDYVIVG